MEEMIVLSELHQLPLYKRLIHATAIAVPLATSACRAPDEAQLVMRRCLESAVSSTDGFAIAIGSKCHDWDVDILHQHDGDRGYKGWHVD